MNQCTVHCTYQGCHQRILVYPHLRKNAAKIPCFTDFEMIFFFFKLIFTLFLTYFGPYLAKNIDQVKIPTI